MAWTTVRPTVAAATPTVVATIKNANKYIYIENVGANDMSYAFAAADLAIGPVLAAGESRTIQVANDSATPDLEIHVLSASGTDVLVQHN